MRVRLNEWLKKEFEPAPALRTARAWIKDGKIYPPPTKVGRAYYVDEKAVYNDGAVRKRLAQRIPQ